MSNPGNDSGDEGFLGRWSARKRRQGRSEADPRVDVGESGEASSDVSQSVLSEAAVDVGRQLDLDSGAGSTSSEIDHEARQTADHAEKPRAEDQNAGRAEAGENEDDAEPLLTDADMPPLDTLSSDSDMSPFFNPGVTAALRRAALRHVFSLASYNVRDGLNDYDDDYTVFEPLGDTVTSDMKFHAARHERNRLEKEAQEAAEREQQLAASSDEAREDEADQEEQLAEADTSERDGRDGMADESTREAAADSSAENLGDADLANSADDNLLAESDMDSAAGTGHEAEPGVTRADAVEPDTTRT